MNRNVIYTIYFFQLTTELRLRRKISFLYQTKNPENDINHDISHGVVDKMTESPLTDDKLKVYWPGDYQLYSGCVDVIYEISPIHSF